ncbi:hypothetical protein EMIHUDRAFT_443922 [Emiliania huxleyi CCMP1516]|uniref:Uncharacterized protein n=2 Tax=Emiliania huxleyi TaxID=2903 RepID=A0A0D3JKZ4_EMIH1|nr:hypothetical protein EMIHUDRAFT_443922 [Emiliania huxleyi CCMP1516]EOD24179.1 hypothetical protein EMIHUDRAFT_443922 [Emiliania huxleyi CCMP1516]|eukprot:XP_005776608.1 hypothetical protein EMIHUDRAFT_443922 [Emiliania huxleyi CCMP1516]
MDGVERRAVGGCDDCVTARLAAAAVLDALHRRRGRRGGGHRDPAAGGWLHLARPDRPAALRHPRVWSVVLRGGAEGGWQGRARNGDGRIPRGVTGVPSGAGLPGAALSSGAGISFLPWISPGAGESVRHVRAPLPPGTKHLREPWAGTGTSSGVSFARELLGRVPISMDD